MPYGLSATLLLDWARLAEDAGFATLAAIDRPHYDSWEPIVTLAAVAAVTDRIRLATTIVQLPQRDEVLLAKQVAVLDQLSAGRVEFGVAAGGREEDYTAFGRSIQSHRWRFREQISRIREVWAEARLATPEHGPIGPAPVQIPFPPIWIGATARRQIERSVEIGDGFIFPASSTPSEIRESIPDLRARAQAIGKLGFTFQAVCHCGVGDPDEVLEVASRQLLRYSRNPSLDFASLIIRGSTDVIAQGVHAYRDAGLDLLILMPQVASLDQVEALARGVLGDYA